MAKLWLTYAWADNDAGDVDHVINELRAEGLDVHFDRRRLVPGQRLWPTIDEVISGPLESDAWALFATPASLASEPCQEELAYALDRALRTKGAACPMLGIVPEPLDRGLIPSAIATRLYVHLNDPTWAKAVAAGARKQSVEPDLSATQPFVIDMHRKGSEYVVEVRPRAGRWYPCAALVPSAERGKMKTAIAGPKGVIPSAGVFSMDETAGSNDGIYRGIIFTSPAIDSRTSLFVTFTQLPSEFAFGDVNGQIYAWRWSALTPP